MSAGVFATDLRGGWRNLLAATLGLSTGVAGYTAISSLFFRAVSGHFHWGSGATAGALIALPITALALPLAGMAIDRWGVRAVAALSVVAQSLSFVWLARLGGTLPEYYLAMIALNVLGCATGPVSYTRLIATQFSGSRGIALAVAQFGIALIAVALPPVLGAIIAGAGWRTAYLLLALVALAGGGAAQLLMREVRGPATRAETGETTGRAIRSAPFWFLAGAVFCVSAATIGLVSQFQSVLLGLGLSLRMSGLLLSLLAVSVMLSRLIVGALLDRPHPARVAAAVIVISAVGALVLAVSAGSIPLILLGVVLFGFSIGAELDLMSFFCARLFGLRNYSTLYGLLGTAFYVGMAAGGIGYGVTRDVTGNYQLALGGTVVLLAVSAMLFLRIRSPST